MHYTTRNLCIFRILARNASVSTLTTALERVCFFKNNTNFLQPVLYLPAACEYDVQIFRKITAKTLFVSQLGVRIRFYT